MASNSSCQAKRRSERHRDKAADQSSERPLSSNHPTSHHSGRASRSVQPIININYNFNGDGMTIKGNALLGPPREEPSRSHLLPPQPDPKVSRLKRKSRERIQIDDESSDASSVYSGRSRESSISRPTRHASSRPVANSLDHAGLDEGYGTSSIQGDRTKKGKEKVEYGSPSVPARKTRRAKPESDDDESSISGDETHLAKEEKQEEDTDDDDDEFAKRTISVADANNQGVEVKAILDTGTTPDWVSQHYLTDVLKLKMCKEKDKKHIDKEFSDFQGKTFKPSGIVELIIISDEFEGVNCRKLWFLVSRLSTFKILLGKKTIRREGLLVRSARAPFLGDAAHVGLQDKTSKKEEAEVARRKNDQDKLAAEQQKKREEKRKAKSKEKQEGRTRSANLAQVSEKSPRRISDSKSSSSSKPSSKSKIKERVVEEKISSESLEGTW